MSSEHGWPMGIGILISGILISRQSPPLWALFAEADTFIGIFNAVLVLIMQLGFYVWGFGYFVAEYNKNIGENMKDIGFLSSIPLIFLNFIIISAIVVIKAIYSFITSYI